MVKYKEVYLKAYESITHAKKEIERFFDRYNIRRRHQGLDEMTPDEVYFSMLSRAKDAV
jgi:putative transposase